MLISNTMSIESLHYLEAFLMRICTLKLKGASREVRHNCVVAELLRFSKTGPLSHPTLKNWTKM